MNPKTVILALFDVLGFESRLSVLGLGGMQSAYDSLIAIVNQMNGTVVIHRMPVGDGTFCPAMGYLSTEQAYFSDTILLWATYDEFRVPAFCQMCASLLCESLRVGLPLRGALSVGDAILDKSRGVYLGAPLIEAARTEAGQAWIGVSFGPSFGVAPYNRSFDARTILPYKKHCKPERENYVQGLVLDWPRYWRENTLGDVQATICGLDTQLDFSHYYGNTLDFFSYSEAQHDWFLSSQHLSANT